MEVGVNWRSQPHFSLLFLIELLSKLLSQIIMKSTINIACHPVKLLSFDFPPLER